MASNIDVQPGERPGKVAVATVEIDGVHYPVYMLADESGVAIDSDNPLPVYNSAPVILASYANNQVEEIMSLLHQTNRELRKMNTQLEVMTGEKLRDGDYDAPN